MERQFTKVFWKNYDALAAAPRPRYISNRGSTRSGKTFAILQLLNELLPYDNPGEVTSVVSETMPHLKRGAIRDFERIIGHPLKDDPHWNASTCTYTYASGALLEFFSADTPSKVAGPARKRLFLNEGNNIPYDTVRQLLVRTTGVVFIDYNPSGDSWITEQIEPRENCTFIHSTYKDNDFLTPEQIAEIESYKDDENWWRVYGRGELGRLEGLIFPDFQLIDELPAGGWDTEVYGMDFGYTNDPSVLVQLRINKGARRIWARQLFYATRLLNDDMARLMEDAQVPRNALIFADCAEPKTIADLSRYGFNVLPCDKGRRKAEQLQLMKGYTLAVTKDSVEGIKELRGYTWAKDRAGKLLNEPIGINDHFIDALRYGFVTYLANYGGGWGLGFV